ncbi:triose-phosphate isomerase [bacterium]|nr:MAG: triose-phosphate isomerase [bacterium]
MRTYFIAGNWKMNLSPKAGAELATAIKEKNTSSKVEIVVCPPALTIASVVASLKGSSIGVGVQNMYTESSGAFTGEVSAEMVQEAGAGYVILGHSERREYFGETDAFINKKTKKALAVGLTPIPCVGEVLAQRKEGKHIEVVSNQVKALIDGISKEEISKVVIAYEPVWAIGTGETASPEQAQEMHAVIRGILTDAYGSDTAEQVRILYGGSMKPENADELLAKKDVDGGLIGGASLKADSFLAIVNAAEKLS